MSGRSDARDRGDAIDRSDARGRETPYDLAFRRGRIDFEGARFEEIRAEAEARGVAVDDPERFVMLGTVGALLRDILLDEATADEAGEVWQALPPQAIAQAGALLYHAWRFRDAGARVHTLAEEETRALVAAPAPAGVRGGSIPGAGYLQLPRLLFWARAEEDAPAEPVDGFFWAFGQRLEVLFALGVRARRPGFTVIPLGIALESTAALERLAATPAREGGVDFDNILPGGELDRLLGLSSAGEALRLAALCLLHVGMRAASDDAASDDAASDDAARDG